jgi:hypothetical protein
LCAGSGTQGLSSSAVPLPPNLSCSTLNILTSLQRCHLASTTQTSFAVFFNIMQMDSQGSLVWDFYKTLTGCVSIRSGAGGLISCSFLEQKLVKANVWKQKS